MARNASSSLGMVISMMKCPKLYRLKQKFTSGSKSMIFKLLKLYLIEDNVSLTLNFMDDKPT